MAKVFTGRQTVRLSLNQQRPTNYVNIITLTGKQAPGLVSQLPSVSPFHYTQHNHANSLI